MWEWRTVQDSGRGWRCLLGGSWLGRSVYALVSLLFLRGVIEEELTICNAGRAPSSSSRSQQKRTWRNQSPTFSPKLVFSEYMMFVKAVKVVDVCKR